MTTSYFVCATPRSGSSLLCEVLASSGLAGHPEEFFWSLFEPEWAARWGTTNDAEYVRAAIHETSTPNGVFGAKVMWEHVEYFAAKLRALPGQHQRPLPDLFDSVFPDLHYVYLYRRDVLRQAVSLSRALQTWVWNETGESRTPLQDPVFDFNAIHTLVREIHEHNDAWRTYFIESGIQPFTVAYEDFAGDREPVARQILEFLGVDLPEPLVFQHRLRKQSDMLSDEWVSRYREEAGAREVAGEPV